MPSGWDNECETIDYVDENGQDYDEMVANGYTFGAVSEVAGYVRRITKPEVLHAETNAIAKVARSTNSTDGADMFVTCAPCLECAKLIHQSGIKRVFYEHTYRNDDGLKFLEMCEIETNHIKQGK
jgi:deoxycytidylate deaminase